MLWPHVVDISDNRVPPSSWPSRCPGRARSTIPYTERLAEASVANSVGSKGDSYDNALAETVNGLYKAELIRGRRWRSVEDVELATAD